MAAEGHSDPAANEELRQPEGHARGSTFSTSTLAKAPIKKGSRVRGREGKGAADSAERAQGSRKGSRRASRRALSSSHAMDLMARAPCSTILGWNVVGMRGWTTAARKGAGSIDVHRFSF